MKITLNAIEFDVTPVAAPLRRALLQDEAIRPGLLRDIVTWRRTPGEAKTYGPVTKEGSVILPNGVLFFVPKVGENGAIEKANGPSLKMSERFLAAMGNKSIDDLQQALHGLFGMMSHKMPLDIYKPYNDVADWNLRLRTEFAVLQLSNTARNLSAFVFIPSQVGFGAVVIEKGEGFEAFAGANAALLARQPGFIVQPRTDAGLLARRIALNENVKDLAAALEGVNVADLPDNDIRRLESNRLSLEWSLLFPNNNQRRA